MSVALFAGFCIGAEADENTYHSDPAAKWHGWLEFGGYYGTDRTSRGEVTVFAPIVQTPDSLFFLDIKGKFFEQNNQEGNFALGYRKMTDSGFNLGAWVGTDIRATSLDNTFWQFSGGVEALSHNYDFRANFYIPLTDPKAGGAGLTQVHLQGNSIFMTGGQEVPLGGADAEAGFRIPLEKLNESFSAVELRAYGGGYYFDSSDANQEVAGGKARLELRVPDVFEALPGSQLTAGYQFTYDDVRQSRHQAGLKLRIPFGEISDADSDRSVQLASLLPQERRMLDGIERDTDIVVTASGRESVIDDATNVALERVAYASDEASLKTAVGMKENTLIIVQDPGANIDITPPVPVPHDGDPNGFGAAGGIELWQRQTLMGGGSTIQLRGAKSGTLAGFTAPGGRPTLTSSPGFAEPGLFGGTIAVAPHTHVAGLNLDGGFTGILGARMLCDYGVTRGVPARCDHRLLENVVIEQMDIRNMSWGGITFPYDIHRNIRIFDNKIRNSGGGIDFSFDNQDITIARNTITDVGFAGIYFFQNGNNIDILHNTIERVGFRGIFLSYDNANVTISGNHIVDGGRDAIWLSGWQDGSTGITGRHVITDNTITGFGVNGIGLFKNHDNVLVSGNTIEGRGGTPFQGAGAGVFISHGNKNIDVTQNTIRNVSGDAISVGDMPDPRIRIPDPAPPNTNLLIADNTLSGIGGNAFMFVNTGHTLLAGSTGNLLTDAPGGQVCGQNVPNSFTGLLSVTDLGGLQIFTDGC
ncbi:right-handed parallel beta-helix repeat-containing protein [Hoeflea sp. TYP-13]|uniref:right-handed parallel beta-helix repeat-containing protein n=1 Tax=Hoeflea sp. TYP-13 TaxID=3230023 RepID=UPI0034C682F2